MEQKFENSLTQIVAGLNCSEATGVYNPMDDFAGCVSTKEKIHSKIIADLLNPSGRHQLGTLLLGKFLVELGIIPAERESFSDAINRISDVKVNTELYAPSGMRRGFIDILVCLKYSGTDYAIIIENKLNDAIDQPRQLERYNDYINSAYSDYKVKTVYLPRIHCDYDGVTVIDATRLAGMIEATITGEYCSNKSAIQAYANYLKNISINNIIMDNAIKLSLMSKDEIREAKAIKEAYEHLPQAFAERLKTAYNEKDGYTAKVSEDYSHYCFIWNEETYRKTGLWLAVGFGHDWYRIYIVSDDETKLHNNGYERKLNVVRSETVKKRIWLAPQETPDLDVKFEGKPECKSLQKTIDAWLDKLNQVAGVK